MVDGARDPVVVGGDGDVMGQGDILPVAVRAYTPSRTAPKLRREQPGPRPEASVLVFDTESRTDPTQRLTFGCWRVVAGGETIDEGLFHGDDLPDTDLEILRAYAASHRADTAEPEPIRLLSLCDFLRKVLWKVAYRERGLVVGLNLPFDWGRIAVDWGEARGSYYGGGFSLTLWEYQHQGQWQENKYRPRFYVKSIDSKRSLMGFGRRLNPDNVDLIPEDSVDGKANPGYVFPGYPLDLRTLAFALTNEASSLALACEAFGVEHSKLEVEAHGLVTPAYIDYARRDVLATAELREKLLEEYARHPIALPPTKAFSPASIGKAYLREMGITPPLVRQPDFPAEVLGHAFVAYYGGRAEAHIRKVPVPVVYLDFLSMYPTVNTFMGLWRFLTASRIETEDATDEVRQLLATIDLERCFDPAFWQELPVLVRVDPESDILPVRAKYGEGDAWQIGLNVLAEGESRWYTLADCIASTLLSGKPLQVLQAVGLRPGVEPLPGLQPVSLRGAVPVDPALDDFFRAVIEQRKSLPTDLPAEERKRLDQFLKVLANSTSYGIFAEMNRQDEQARVVVHGLARFETEVSDPEEPGEFSFPPLAAFIAGAARLMLALLERSVTDLGGTYAICDTDSMAIVANEECGLVTCPGGPETYRRKPAIRALTWAQVEGIRQRFARLNPYDPDKISGSVLELEEVNYTPCGFPDHKPGCVCTQDRRSLWCYAISAKRYCLYVLDDKGEPMLAKWSEHGLGHLLNPTDPDSDDRKWLRQIWEGIVREALGFSPQWPAWLDRPALSRLTISSPALLEPFADLNADKPYPDQVKPFNFMLTTHVARFGHPDGVDPTQFQLIAPYEPIPQKWLRLPWINRYSGERYRITTTADTGGAGMARVQTYRDVLEDFLYHPEAKSAGPGGRPCRRQTVGLLGRRVVRSIPELTTHVGKESNQLEEVEAGIEHSPDEVWAEYRDPRRDPWETLVLPVLKQMPAKRLAEETGLAMSTVKAARNGHTKPHGRNQKKFIHTTAAFAREYLQELGIPAPDDDLACCAALLSRAVPT